jgi:hypothetical protein
MATTTIEIGLRATEYCESTWWHIACSPHGMPVAQQRIASRRDDGGVGPNEEVSRDPDGVPHDVVGLSALFSFLLAALVLGMWLTGSTTGRVSAIALLVFGVPMLVSGLRERADRERDRRDQR